MKKMMMVMVAIAMAAIAQAASVDWSTAKNTVVMKDGTVGTGVSLYILNTASSSYDTLIAALTDGSATAANLSDYAAYVGTGTTGSGKKAGAASGIASSAEFTSGTTYNLAYLVFDKADNKDYFYISSTANGQAWAQAEDQALSTPALWDTSSAAGTWTAVQSQSVPEPTSGLLLLLGMAGLALKRKRA